MRNLIGSKYRHRLKHRIVTIGKRVKFRRNTQGRYNLSKHRAGFEPAYPPPWKGGGCAHKLPVHRKISYQRESNPQIELRQIADARLSGSINAVLKLRQGRKNLIKTRRFGEVHVPHRLVIAPQRQAAFAAGTRRKVPGFAGRSSPTHCRRTDSSMHDPVAEVVLVDCLARVGCWPAPPYPRSGGRTGRAWVSRPAGGTRCGGSSPSPRSSAPLPAPRLRTASREMLGEDIGHPRADRVAAGRLLVGERAEFQLHRAFQVIEPGRLRRWVVEQEDRRVGAGVRQKLEPRRLSFPEHAITAASIAGPIWSRTAAPQAASAFVIHLFAWFRLVPASGSFRKCRRQRQVDVFREPFDDAEHLRQRRAALEHQAAGELRSKEDAQKPADPEVLLQHHRGYVPRIAACSMYRRRSSGGKSRKPSFMHPPRRVPGRSGASRPGRAEDP